MESQPQNPEFRNNPENFQPCNLYHMPDTAPIMDAQKCHNVDLCGFFHFIQ